MEIAGHEEVKAANISQINTTQLENEGGYERDQVYDQQILCNGRYAEHHVVYCLMILKSLFFFFFRNLLQNYEKYLCFVLKSPQIQLFFMKKWIFSDFLLFL